MMKVGRSNKDSQCNTQAIKNLESSTVILCTIYKDRSRKKQLVSGWTTDLVRMEGIQKLHLESCSLAQLQRGAVN